MALPEYLKQPIKGLGPISEEQAKELLEKAKAAVGPPSVAGAGESQPFLDAITAMREVQEYRTRAAATQVMNAADGYFHERDVITRAEGAFAAKHGLTTEDLETAWGQKREGIEGQLFRGETEQKAALRDQFFALVDAIGAEQMGEGYDYGQFIAETRPDALLQAVQARLDAQQTGVK